MRMFSKLCVVAGLVGLLAGQALATDHLIVTEFCVTPTDGEFIEIYNPTQSTVSLADYYLTDATYSGGNTYYYFLPDYYGGGGGVPGGGTFGDFYGRFPADAEIAPGEYQTICMSGSDAFTAEYGVDPTYELWEDALEPDAIPDMLEAFEGSINGQGGLTNAGEVIIFLYWDGEYDLVYDVDYVLWGDKVEGVDKTGIAIDGPDADSDSTMYQPDTPIAEQTVVNADDDADEEPHDMGMTAQRAGVEEGPETLVDGNGITGHDETSEDMTIVGGSWTLNEPATPNRGPALYSVMLTPYQTIVPRTGTLDFHQTVTNSASASVNLWQRFYGVKTATSDTVYTSNPKLYQLGPGESADENFALPVPGGAPVEGYKIITVIATMPGPVIEGEDSFDLTVVTLP